MKKVSIMGGLRGWLLSLPLVMLCAIENAVLAQDTIDRIQRLTGKWVIPATSTTIIIFSDHFVFHSYLGQGDIKYENAEYYIISYRQRALVCHYQIRAVSGTEIELIRAETLDSDACNLGALRRAPWQGGDPGEAPQIWLQVKDSTDPALLQAFVKQYESLSPEYSALARNRIAELQYATHSSQAAAQWKAIENTISEAVLSAFIDRFGDTDYGNYARARLKELRRQKTASVSPPVSPAPSPALPPKTSRSDPGVSLSLVQEMLIWTGYYDGLITGTMTDGTLKAVKKYQASMHSPQTGELEGEDARRLVEQGSAEKAAKKNATGFAVEVDPVSGIGLGMPKHLLSKSGKNRVNGMNWGSKRDRIDIDTIRILDGRSLEQLYNKLKDVKGRSVDYYDSSRNSFILYGREKDGKKFYVRVVQDQGEIRGFSVIFEENLYPLVIAMSSSFTPFP